MPKYPYEVTDNIIPAFESKNLNVKKFVDEVRGWFGNIQGGIQSAHRETVRIFFRTVYEFTPKLSGYAAYNWDVAISSEPDSSLEPRVRKVIGRTRNGQPLIQQTYFGTRSGEPDLERIRWNSNTLVYNFVPYIEKINKRSSSPGFFEHAKNTAEVELQRRLKAI